MSASAELTTRYGRTFVAWRIEDGRFTLDVVIPPNAYATVTLSEDAVTGIGSGSRSFTCRWPV